MNEFGHSLLGRHENLGLTVDAQDGFEELSIVRGWVGFDEENVVVLREKNEGSQALVVYDFT
jgi:hypothetical protein